MSDNGSTKNTEKREYFPPKIVHDEKITSRASACMKSDSNCTVGQPGPLQS